MKTATINPLNSSLWFSSPPPIFEGVVVADSCNPFCSKSWTAQNPAVSSGCLWKHVLQNWPNDKQPAMTTILYIDIDGSNGVTSSGKIGTIQQKRDEGEISMPWKYVAYTHLSFSSCFLNSLELDVILPFWGRGNPLFHWKAAINCLVYLWCSLNILIKICLDLHLYWLCSLPSSLILIVLITMVIMI